MKIINKLQYIFLFFLSFIIVGAAAVITGDVGFNIFKEASFYINQLLTDAAILCVTFATLYAYLDKFKETDVEYLSNIDYIRTFATGKNNIPSILSRFLETINKKRKIKQFEHNLKRKLYFLENKRKFKWFGPKTYTEKDYYIWNHGTLEEKQTNVYCKKRMFIEEQLTKEFIEKNIDIKYVKYDKITSEIILGGFYRDEDNNNPNDFITKHPESKVAKHKIPQLLFSFAMMFFLSSFVFGEILINTNTIINFCIKVLVLVWNSYTSLRFAKDFSQCVTLKDTRFRKGIILEYEKWLIQEANKVIEQDKIAITQKEQEAIAKQEPPKEVDINDTRGNPTTSISQSEI